MTKTKNPMRLPVLGAALVLLGAAALSPALAQDGEMTEAMMAEAMAKMAPGEKQAELAKLAGEWNAKVTSWHAPGMEPEVSDATATLEMVLDGRYLKQTMKGSMMGMPYTGIGFTGYDNLSGEYRTVWMDSIGTGMMFASGTGDGMTMTATTVDPMSGAEVPLRMVTEIVSDKEHRFVMYMKLPDGTEFKGMEIVYTRK